MKIYAVRHGETNMGKSGLIATIDEPLNDFGETQAINLGNELRNKNIDVIYCSPIQRAKDTLNLFYLDKKIPIIIEKRLEERNMGVYENISFDKLDWKEFWNINSENKYSELESMKNVYARVSDFLNELKVENIDKNILIVTHGGVMRAINWYFNGIDDKMFVCNNCEICTYDTEKWR